MSNTEEVELTQEQRYESAEALTLQLQQSKYYSTEEIQEQSYIEGQNNLCPFCGSEAPIITDIRQFIVNCQKCDSISIVSLNRDNIKWIKKILRDK